MSNHEDDMLPWDFLDEEELPDGALLIGREEGLLPTMTEIQFRKFKNYYQRKGGSLPEWHQVWRSWCRKAIQFKPELKYVPASPKKVEEKVYGKFPVPDGFTQNYTPVEDKNGNRICIVYWNSAFGKWEQSNGIVWKHQNNEWHRV